MICHVSTFYFCLLQKQTQLYLEHYHKKQNSTHRDLIGLYLKGLGNKFSYKKMQLFELFQKIPFISKTPVGTFWVKIGLLFIIHLIPH